MKLKNSTSWPTHFLRRLIGWCCQELGLPASKVRLATFTRYGRSGQCRGTAFWRSRILIRLNDKHVVEQGYAALYLDGEKVKVEDHREGYHAALKAGDKFCGYEIRRWTAPVELYPQKWKYPGRVNTPTCVIADRTEALVHVVSHELAHLERWHCGVSKNREAAVDATAIVLLEAFRKRRDELVAEWDAVPAERPEKARPSVVERRQAKAQADLERWARKLKLAQTKVRKCKARVSYYERAAAKRSSSPSPD